MMQLPMAVSSHSMLADRNWRPYTWSIKGQGQVLRRVDGWVDSPGAFSDVDRINYEEEVDAINFSLSNFTGERAPISTQPDFTVAPNVRPRWIDPSGGPATVTQICPVTIQGANSQHFQVVENGSQMAGAFEVVEMTLKVYQMSTYVWQNENNAYCACEMEVNVRRIGYARNGDGPPWNFFEDDWFAMEGTNSEPYGEWEARSRHPSPSSSLQAGQIIVTDHSVPLTGQWGGIKLYRSTMTSSLELELELACLQRYLPHPQI